MKKIILLAVLFLITHIIVLGQTKELDWNDYSSPPPVGSSKSKMLIHSSITSRASQYPNVFSVREISKPVFYKIVSKDFTRIASGGPDAPGTSSYAFADIAKPTVSLGAAFAFKDCKKNYVGHFVSLSAKAGINENTAQLFSNNKFSAAFGGQILFSHLLCFDVRLSENDTKFQLNVDSIVTRNILQEDSISNKISLEETKLESILYAIQNQDPTIFSDLYPAAHIQNRLSIYIARLRILSDETIAKLEILRARRQQIVSMDYKGAAIETYPKLKRNYTWISYGISANNTEFRLYNPNEMPLLNNVSKTSFLSWNLPVRLNYLSESNINNGANFYLFAEVSVGRSDNLNDLNKFNYKRDHTIKDTDTSKSVSESFEVYRNKGADEYKQFHYLKFAYSHLHFFNKQRIVGVTGYIAESSRYYTHDLPIHGIMDFGLGVFISVPNKKKGEAAVNMELYSRFFDIFNRNKTRDSKFYDRNLIALKIGIPFQIVAN